MLKAASVPAIVQKESPSFPRKRWPQAKVGEEVKLNTGEAWAVARVSNSAATVPSFGRLFVVHLRRMMGIAGWLITC